jgi:hypothetical protein
MAAFTDTVDFRPVLPRRNNYRRLWIDATTDRIALQHTIRELRHEVETLRLEKSELEAARA